HRLRRDLSSPALPIFPQSVSRGARIFGASRFAHSLRPAKLLAPLYGSDRYTRPPGAFTPRLPTDRLPSPLLDTTTTATGLLCWRDFHPLEWQLLVARFNHFERKLVIRFGRHDGGEHGCEGYFGKEICCAVERGGARAAGSADSERKQPSATAAEGADIVKGRRLGSRGRVE